MADDVLKPELILFVRRDREDGHGITQIPCEFSAWTHDEHLLPASYTSCLSLFVVQSQDRKTTGGRQSGAVPSVGGLPLCAQCFPSKRNSGWSADPPRLRSIDFTHFRRLRRRIAVATPDKSSLDFNMHGVCK